MKYRKLTLDLSTVGLIKDRLNRMTSNGIVKIEGAWGDQNPTKKKVEFTQDPSIDRNRTVQVRKKDFFTGPGLFISTEGIGWHGGTPFAYGDIFYLSNDVIFVKSGKPDAIQKKIHITKITLLSRSDAPHAMRAYREDIRSTINMCCYYNGWDRYGVPDEEVDQHIAFLDENKGKDVQNPIYKEKESAIDLFIDDDDFDDSGDDLGDDIDELTNIDA